MIKRYRPAIRAITYGKFKNEDAMEENNDGEWVKWEDVKKQLDDMIDKLDFHGINHRWRI